MDELGPLPGVKVMVEMAKGFSVYMLKAVKDGRATDIIEFASSNLLR